MYEEGIENHNMMNQTEGTVMLKLQQKGKINPALVGEIETAVFNYFHSYEYTRIDSN
jgi:hypothetical protein